MKYFIKANILYTDRLCVCVCIILRNRMKYGRLAVERLDGRSYPYKVIENDRKRQFFEKQFKGTNRPDSLAPLGNL